MYVAITRARRAQPLQTLGRQFVEKPARHVVARLPMQQPGLRVRQVQPPPRTGNGHVHQAPLLFQSIEGAEAVFVGKQTFLQPGDEDGVELQPLGGMYRHQLHRRLPRLGLMLACFQRGMGQKSRQGGNRLAGVGLHRGSILDVGAQCHRVASPSLLHHETFGGIDQFGQVFQPLGAVAVGAVVIDQATVGQHALDDFAQRPPYGALAHHVQPGHEGHQVGTTLATDGSHRVVQGAAQLMRRLLQLLQGPRPDAPRGKIDHPQKAVVIVRVFQQTQIRQRVLDLGTLEKAQAAVDAIRNTGVEQGAFEGAALCIAAVQQGDFVRRDALLTRELADLLHHPLSLFVVAGQFDDAHGVALTLLGAQVFAQALPIVLDETIGGMQDVAHAAVVALQLDGRRDAEFAHEVAHIAHACAAKGVDALIVVAHRQHRVARGHEASVLFTPSQQFQPRILQAVGVLKLIHQNVPEAPLVVRADGLVIAQQLVRAQQQLAKIHHPFALTLSFVGGVELDAPALLLVARPQVVRAQSFFLGVGDEPLQLFGLDLLLIHLQALEQPLDGAELILHVQDLERGWQTQHLVMRAQHAVAQPMKGANPHATHVQRQQRRQARQHLARCLVGEGHRQNRRWGGLSGGEQPSDAGGQHARLTRSCPRQDQCRNRRQGHGGALLGVEGAQ
ncbi:hypothetical protein Tchar_01712 [Tepidimonas charontis]|uniref:Uncharacterized protein n=1 Tax=Tepidimonas charontis TaxID=2267262 RepID=A0A554XCU3_9BURK|nr:hypothetical protein Tchar_01712 [Tepidimonas charontis]